MRAMILAGVLAAAVLVEPVARADGPDAEHIAFAAREHDLGYAAYTANRYDEAATHFENAYFAAPNPKELRAAIRARRDANEYARAATDAAIALKKYASDAATKKAADDAIAEARGKVYEIDLACGADCDVVVDGKLVATEKSTAVRFFVDPGHHELAVGFGDDRSVSKSVDAVAGGSTSLSVDAPAPKPVPPPPPPPPPTATATTSQPPPPLRLDHPVAPPSSKPFGPAVFFATLGLTAVAGGLTIWSGVDAENNPGKDAVLADCVGKGTSCPQYQEGLSAQRRTNILIGVTGGLGAVTLLVGAFLTQWRKPAATQTAVTPLVGPGEIGLAGTF